MLTQRNLAGSTRPSQMPISLLSRSYNSRSEQDISDTTKAVSMLHRNSARYVDGSLLLLRFMVAIVFIPSGWSHLSEA